MFCDAPDPPAYIAAGGSVSMRTICRCVICPRCNHHTGNSHQGHYWAYCMVTGSMRTRHMCCPNNCELEADQK